MVPAQMDSNKAAISKQSSYDELAEASDTLPAPSLQKRREKKVSKKMLLLAEEEEKKEEPERSVQEKDQDVDEVEYDEGLVRREDDALRGVEFTDDGERWRVLKVEYDAEHETCVAFYYPATTTEANIDDCEYSSLEEVKRWIARDEKKRHKLKRVKNTDKPLPPPPPLAEEANSSAKLNSMYFVDDENERDEHKKTRREQVGSKSKAPKLARKQRTPADSADDVPSARRPELLGPKMRFKSQLGDDRARMPSSWSSKGAPKKGNKHSIPQPSAVELLEAEKEAKRQRNMATESPRQDKQSELERKAMLARQLMAKLGSPSHAPASAPHRPLFHSRPPPYVDPHFRPHYTPGPPPYHYNSGPYGRPPPRHAYSRQHGNRLMPPPPIPDVDRDGLGLPKFGGY